MQLVLQHYCKTGWIVACEQQTHFRSSLHLPPKNSTLFFEGRWSDDRKCVCCSQASWIAILRVLPPTSNLSCIKIRLLTFFNVIYKTRKTSCTFFVAHFTEALVVSLIMFLKKCLLAKRRILFYSFFLVLYLLINGSDSLFIVTFFSIHFNFHCRARHLVRCC